MAKELLAVLDGGLVERAWARGRSAQIALDQLTIDPKLQSRELHSGVVDDYTQAMRREDKFPPVRVIQDSEGHLFLVDGHHRVAAARALEREQISAEILDGTFDDALWLSWGANGAHGLRRTQKDKRRALRAALEHATWQARPDREIARHVGCDHKTVAAMRRKLSGEFPQRTERQGQISPGPSKYEILKASRLLAKVRPEQYRQFNDAELATVRAGHVSIHRLLYGAKTLPNGLPKAA